MYVPGKLKEDRSITFLLPALVTLALFFVALASGGPPLGWLVLGLAFAFFVKWRGREILGLAALPVKPTPDVLTSRPRPAGRAEYTRSEILSFAELLHRNHLAWAYREADRVVLSPVKQGKEFPYLYGWSVPDYHDRTWVAFDFDGNVSARVSREELSLDALCESLAGLFVGFLEQFRKGEARRIVERLDAVSPSPVS